MAYGSFTKVTGTIAEREYCVSEEIKTTAVTSCIIVVSPVSSSMMLGIHLSIFGEGGDLDDSDADRVGEIMRSEGADMDNVHIFGMIDFWGPGQPSGYTRLMQVLGDPWRKAERDGAVTVTRGDLR